MANHKSAKKRIRSDNTKRLRNRFYAKSARRSVNRLRNTTKKEEALERLPRVISLIDRVAKKNVIHKNKASNLKSKLTKYANSL